MKAVYICLILTMAAGLCGMGTESDSGESAQPEAVQNAQNVDADLRMLVGELRSKYGNWYIETEDDVILIVLPERTVLEQKECSLSRNDQVIIWGRFVRDRFSVESLEKSGVRYTFTE